MTLTEPLRMSKRKAHLRDYDETGGGREDDSNLDSDDKTRATKCRDYDESGGGREDGLNLGSDDERACTYIRDTNYVALA